jgi:hypothetical protein
MRQHGIAWPQHGKVTDAIPIAQYRFVKLDVQGREREERPGSKHSELQAEKEN